MISTPPFEAGAAWSEPCGHPRSARSTPSGVSGVDQPVRYALLKTLVERGEVVKEEFPGGVTGYRLPADASPAAAGAPATNPSRPALVTSCPARGSEWLAGVLGA
jgi:hypothetical protein